VKSFVPVAMKRRKLVNNHSFLEIYIPSVSFKRSTGLAIATVQHFIQE
jgi:hypothetical protein